MKQNNLTFLLATAVLGTLLFFGACKPDPEPVPGPEPTDIKAETPRYMAPYDGAVYITCYNPPSVIRFDTATQHITGICTLGQFHPEGICALNGKLYIASSNISDEAYNYTYDNKLYVVDIATMTLCDSIVVGLNPAKVMVLDDNHIVVNSQGDYPEMGGSVYGALHIVNVNNKEVSTIDLRVYNFDVYNGNIYGYLYTYGSSFGFYTINGATHQYSPILADWTHSDSPYGISVNKYNGDIIVTTDGQFRSHGECVVYTKDGTPRLSLEAGMLPSKAVALDADHLLVLDEGNWGNNEAEISYIDLADNQSLIPFFTNANGRGLGDVGQDLIVYGGKAYATVSMSNSIEVFNPRTGKSTHYSTN